MTSLQRQLTGFPSPPPRHTLLMGAARVMAALGPHGVDAIRDVSLCPQQRTVWLRGSARRMQDQLMGPHIHDEHPSGKQTVNPHSPRRRVQRALVVVSQGKLAAPHSDSRGLPFTHSSWQDRDSHWRGRDWIGDYGCWDELEYGIMRLMGVDNPPEGDPHHVDLDDWTVVPVPDPGGPQYHHWSFTDKRWEPPTDFTPYRICDQPRIDLGDRKGPALLQLEGFGKKNFPPLFCSHGISLENLHKVRHCGSLIWPSFAVTWQVPPSYGDIVFLADTRWMAGLFGSKGRGKENPGVLLSPSDAWTLTVRSVERHAKAINHELSGDRDWWAGDVTRDQGSCGNRGLQDDLVTTGLSKDEVRQVFAPDVVEEGDIRTTSQLARRLEAILAQRRRYSTDPYCYPTREEISEIAKRAGHGAGVHYGYMELKVMNQVRIGSLPVCLYPRRNSTGVNRFLDRVGFRGWRIPFTWGGPRRSSLGKGTETEAGVRRAWAQKVTETILDWAKDPCEYPVDAMPRGVFEEHYNVHQFRAGITWNQTEKSTDGEQWRACGPQGATRGHFYSAHGLNIDDASTSSWGHDKHGAGILLTTGDKLLLLERTGSLSEGGTWAAPGGSAKPLESEDLEGLLGAAWREFNEECGGVPDGVVPNDHEVLAIQSFVSPKSRLHPEALVFTTFVIRANEEFEPELNWENTDWRWFTREELADDQLLADMDIELHPGTKALLDKEIDTIFFEG